MTDASPRPLDIRRTMPFAGAWPAWRSLLLLAVLTLACLLPFSNKAFHMDDPLFVWTAQHIAQHPLDPYGFRVVWYATETPIAEVTKNPPLASYYMALAGSTFGWSERALHLAFLLPALATVLGTYLLAQRFTQMPFFGAAATLVAPGFLVSSTTLMCDVLMLAFWIFAVILWVRATESGSHLCFFSSALLVSACALTKYFGIALIPLLLVYSLQKKRGRSPAILYLGIPLLLLWFYQYWTRGLYGRGLLSDAVQYASFHNRGHELSVIAKLVEGLVFSGGCALPVLFFASLLWRRRWILLGVAAALIAGLAIAGHPRWFDAPRASAHWPMISAQMAVLSAGGLSMVGLAGSCLLVRENANGLEPANFFTALDADRVLLGLWLAGTFVFATFFNWTINARSILPLIPAAGILIAQRVEATGVLTKPSGLSLAGIALLASAAISIWAARADAQLAAAGRTAADQLSIELRNSQAPVYFEGHWGFQYYMQPRGARPADLRNTHFHAGDVLVIPENTTNSFGPPPGFVLAVEQIRNFELNSNLATMSQPLGVGFYASVWGPLPLSIGAAPAERYLVARLAPQPATANPDGTRIKP